MPHSLHCDFFLPDIADGEDKSSPLLNRLRKNYRLIRKFGKKTGTNCFRLYSGEIREYPLTIDYYDGRLCIHYLCRARELSAPPQELKKTAEEALKKMLGASLKAIYWKVRAKKKESRQYEKLAASGEFFPVFEYGARFYVNLRDYLDTGLFLDHRETRRMVASLSEGKNVLNLFAYTCSFSVHAALKGAATTTSIDLSNTYTSWGKENFELNHIPLEHHKIIRGDCLKIIKELNLQKERFDVIIIDPPTISRSKKMDQLFDIQQDYLFLLAQAIQLLAPQGLIFFSTNSKKFRLDPQAFPSCRFEEITAKTTPLDFHTPIHRCWKISLV